MLFDLSLWEDTLRKGNIPGDSWSMDSCLPSAITFGSRINTIHARILAIAFDLRENKARLVCIDDIKGSHSKDDPNLSIVTKVTLADLAMLIVPELGETYCRQCGHHRVAI